MFEMEKMSLFKNALINQRENKMSPMTHAVQPREGMKRGHRLQHEST